MNAIRRFGAVWLLAAGACLNAQQPDGNVAGEVGPHLRQFLDVFGAVQSRGAGVDGDTLNRALYEGAIPGMLRRLDPHTQFFEPAQFDQLKQMEASEEKGFGSIVSVLPGQVIFLQIFPGTPTSKAGIQPGDELVAINNVVIQNLNPEQIVGLLTQARQQQITIFLRRQGALNIMQATLTPEVQDAHTVDRAFLVASGIGYIRATSWDNKTAREIQDAINQFGSPLTGLVIDLRDNPGGIVKSALDGASMFLKPGQRILTAKGRSGTVETVDVPQDAKPYGFALAVLVNGRTASASEIFAGALQDHDRAAIVGERSYGKGLVQSVLALSDNAGLAITTAFYYTPSGRSIQHPLDNTALATEFSSSATAKLPQYKTDAGRVVTGGGGIIPDIPAQPRARTQLEAVLDGSGVLTAYATSYVAQHPGVKKDVEITPEMVDDLKVFLAQRNIQPSAAEWSAELEYIRSRMQEEITIQTRGVAAGDQIAAKRDPVVRAAVKALQETRKS